MTAMSSSARISLSVDLSWSNKEIAHRESLFIHRLNPWRDVFPESFFETMINQALARGSGPVSFDLPPGGILPQRDPHLVLELDRSRLNDTVPFDRIDPGRFYPQGLIRGLPGVFKGNATPFYCLEKQARGIVADLNHPLAGLPLKLTAGPPVVHSDAVERGGSCTDWMDLLFTGPGMQNPNGSKAMPANFRYPAFDRKDTRPDPEFYRTDRFVHHIDDEARAGLARWYARLLSPEDRILDLMAGWDSHLPENMGFSQVHGLGLNANEMAANPGLTEFLVLDLNQAPVLSFADHSFDAVVCSLSVEYLTDPVSVFREAGRVLRPGGLLAVSFSNRWFPEKAISVWPELHEFERLGFVLALFRETGMFTRLSTMSLRGRPRPVTDRYFPQLRLSDPLFGVAGYKMA